MDIYLKFALFALFDLICIILALVIGSPITIENELSILTDYTGASFFTGVLFIISYYTLDCYPLSRKQYRDIVPRVILATFLATVLTGFTFYLLEIWKFPRLLYIIQFTLTMTFTISWRLVYIKFQRRLAYKERIILYGPGPYDDVLDSIAENTPEAEILGYVGSADIRDAENPLTYLGTPEDIIDIATGKQASIVMLMPDTELDKESAALLLSVRLEYGIVVEVSSSYVERMSLRVPVEQIRDSWLLMEYGFSLNEYRFMRRVKRTIDIGVAGFLLVLTAPLTFILCAIIRMESEGPAIYRQKRVGLHGKDFTLYKLRSMALDAEKNGAVWAMQNDPRVTRVGKIIRKLRLDELPQLLNVLRGDMSLIGPRPERPEFVDKLEQIIPYFYLRQTVKPGMTGWAQVSYPYGASEEDARIKLEYDLYYIKNMSLFFDLKIMLKTVGVVLFPSGAR